MTDGELAVSWIRSQGWSEKNLPSNEFGQMSQAFLAGLKAGRQEKWHNVAKGDYPPCEKGSFTINVLTDRGEIAYYDYNLECWIVEPSSAEIDPPIAWCEIPKFEE